MNVSLYRRHRFPSEIIGHCVRLYYRVALSYRDINEMMAKRGVFVSHESMREWSLKLGTEFAKRIRHQSARAGDQWYLEEVYLSIGGKPQHLWRAVDQDGEVLDILVQARRNKPAAKRFFRKLLKSLRYLPRVLITDKLGSDAAAKAEIMPGMVHLRDKGKNHRAENPHQPTPERERRMRGFKPSGHAQRFPATVGVIASFFRPGRHLLAAENYREIMRRRFVQWNEIAELGAEVG